MTGNLTRQEIDYLINRYKTISGAKNISEIHFRILELKRSRWNCNHFKTLEYTEQEITHVDTIKTLCRDILNYIGYTQNTIYKREVEILSSNLCSNILWNLPHGQYSNEELALSIVIEVLDYYNATYELKILIDTYNIDINNFIWVSLNCHQWCKQNYWKA